MTRDDTKTTDHDATIDGNQIAPHLRDPGVEAGPDDPIDPAAEGRVVNRIGPGLSEPEKGTGQTTSPDHADRVPDGEGARAPHQDELGHAEHSVYDGAGGEVVVVTSTNEDGRLAQGSGRTADDAVDDAREGGYPAN